MKRKTFIIILSAMALVGASIPATAATDPNVTTTAYIGYSQKNSKYIRGKTYAITTNPKMTSLNVQGKLYKSSTLLETSTGSTTSIGSEAASYTLDETYSASVSHTLQAASRTYYSGGSYDQDYASYNW